MRLTHLYEYKDKRKNREPMVKIRNKWFDYENIEEKHNIKSLDDLDDRLTALEVIKEKRVEITTLMDCRNAEECNRWVPIRSHYSYRPFELTQKEYKLLKEELL